MQEDDAPGWMRCTMFISVMILFNPTTGEVEHKKDLLDN